MAERELGQQRQTRGWWARRRPIIVVLLYFSQYDVSLPLDNYFELVEVLKQRLSGKSQVVHGFGHIGDSNLHVTIVSDTHSQELMELIEPFIFDWTGEI